MSNFTNYLISKFFSARFLATMLVILTLCVIVNRSMDLIETTIANEKAFSLAKEIVMFILGAFVSVVTAVVTSYFNRPDRQKQEQEETK